VHPALAQALAAERVRDMRSRASARNLARSLRRHHRRQVSLSRDPARTMAGPIARAPHPAVPQAGAGTTSRARSAGAGNSGTTHANAA
jgi:hypothetical protein